MNNELGIGALSLAMLLTGALSYRNREIAMPLIVAVIVRTAASLFHFYIAPLPDGRVDAVTFEQVAWELSTSPGNLFSNFNYTASYIYSAMASLIYAVLGRSPLMLQALSVMVGTTCVYLTWKVATQLWDKRAARISAWIAALAPTAILYSALTMREVYFSACLLVGVLYVARWAQKPSFANLIGATLAFCIGVLFHGGMAAALFAFWALVALRSLRHFLSALQRGNLHIATAATIFSIFGGLIVFIMLDLDIPKLGRPSELLETERYLRMVSVGVRGSAAYPDWMIPLSSIDLTWIIPARAIYLMLSPFIWDISEATHLMGFLDGLFYLLLFLGMFFGFSRIIGNRSAVYILIILIALIITFGAGTGNFGAALRHRAKLLPVIIVFAAPFFPRFVSIPRIKYSLERRRSCE